MPVPVRVLHHRMSVQRDRVGSGSDRYGADLDRFGIHRPTQKSRTARMVRINVTIHRTYTYIILDDYNTICILKSYSKNILERP